MIYKMKPFKYTDNFLENCTRNKLSNKDCDRH